MFAQISEVINAYTKNIWELLIKKEMTAKASTAAVKTSSLG